MFRSISISSFRVQSAGVYHSDIHLWKGGYEGPGGQFLKAIDRGVKYPLTPGHEVAGYIDSLGEEASIALEGSIGKNKKVLIYPWIGEGLCPGHWISMQKGNMQNMYWYQVIDI